MAVHLLIILAIVFGITAVTTFVLYGRARMKEDEQQEKLFLRIHYTALFLLLLVGVIFLFYMVETSD